MSELDGLWLFGELAQADRALVLRSTHRHRYPAGTYLYHAGELNHIRALRHRNDQWGNEP